MEQTPVPPAGSGERPPEPRGLFYLLSVLFPIAGIVIGAIFLGKPTQDCKDFGKTCLICALIPAAISCVCILGVFLIAVAHG